MTKRQKVDASLQLALRDEQIARDYKILEKLKLTVRNNWRATYARSQGIDRTALYTRYRGNGFPLVNERNRRLPAWRSLSPWMKAQLVALCIAEHEHRHFRVRIHDDVRERLESEGKDLKVYLRDRISRRLREGLGNDPWFLFVIEDLDTDGNTLVRPHAHGVLVIWPRPFSAIKNNRSRAAYARRIPSVGQDFVELVAGLALTRKLLKQATGNGERSAEVVNGVSQKGNVWLRPAYHVLFNDQGISYAFKNSDSPLSELPANRLAISQGARAEAQRFWELIRKGEQATSQWR